MSRVLYNADNQITCGYKKGSHNGVDVVKKWNKTCYIISHSDGEVIEVQNGIPHEPGSTGLRSYGNYVKIRHNDGYMTLYAHLKSVSVKNGQIVKRGEKIGYMGESGNAYGAHLHFEVRNPNNQRINPEKYLDSDLPYVNRKLLYQAYDNKKKMWLPNVEVGTNEYAGNYKNPIGGIYADKYEMRVHDVKLGYWLPWVNNRNDYAGNLGNNIDGVQIKNATYRVHLVGGGWLSWVYKVDNSNEGYAGVYGKIIDAVQIK